MADIPPRRTPLPPELGDPAFRRRLVAQALRLAHPNDAEDLVADAIAQACEPGASITGPGDVPLFGRLLRRMRDRVIAGLRTRRGQSEIVDSVITDAYSDDGPHFTERVEDADHFERLGAMLRETLAARGDVEALAVFDKKCEGVETPLELARALGTSVPKVKNANARILDLARAVQAADKRAAARSALGEPQKVPVS